MYIQCTVLDVCTVLGVECLLYMPLVVRSGGADVKPASSLIARFCFIRVLVEILNEIQALDFWLKLKS